MPLLMPPMLRRALASCFAVAMILMPLRDIARALYAVVVRALR